MSAHPAHHVLITKGNKGALQIDGYDFPWLIAAEPIIRQSDDIIEVSLTIYTESVTVTYETKPDAD